MKYKFTKEIKNKLEYYKNYLTKKAYSESTIKQKSNYTGLFLTWVESEYLQTEETTYKDMLSFIDYCNLSEGLSKKHINTILLSVRNYYEYLKESRPDLINPVLNLQVKGVIRKQAISIISYQKLEVLYTKFNGKTNRDKRNKVILGLLIYQGITTEELHQLQVDDLKLKQGKICIPGGRRRNSRILELNPCQILDLHEYLTKIRLKLNPQNTDQLILSMEGNLQLKNSLHHLFRSIKKKNSMISSAKQIRTTVITNWLKTLNLREVQYRAGHKYVSSTERYQSNDLENLQTKLDKFHPLNNLD